MAARCGDTDSGPPNPSLPCPRYGLVAHCDAVCQASSGDPPDLAPLLQATLENGLRVNHRSQLGNARLGTRVPSHGAPGEAPDLPPSPAPRQRPPDHHHAHQADTDTVVRLPKGGAIWQCARLFVEFTALHTADLLGLLTGLDPPPAAAAACPLGGIRVVELGAGTGVCGLSLAVHTGVGTVTLTDGDPNVLPLLRHNVWLNQQCSGVTVTQLGWGCAGHIASACNANGGPFDLAVASDCTYKAALCDPLFTTASRLLRPGGVLCLVHKHFCCPDAALEDAVARSSELEWISDADVPFMAVGWLRRSMVNEAGNPREISLRLLRRVLRVETATMPPMTP